MALSNMLLFKISHNAIDGLMQWGKNVSCTSEIGIKSLIWFYDSNISMGEANMAVSDLGSAPH
jgi:hypothetical protein